jgi:hypothetical protein
MLPLLRPYVLAACQMRRKTKEQKKQPFKHCQKNQLIFHLPAFETEKNGLHSSFPDQDSKTRNWMATD